VDKFLVRTFMGISSSFFSFFPALATTTTQIITMIQRTSMDATATTNTRLSAIKSESVVTSSGGSIPVVSIQNLIVRISQDYH
jgi:hypothetical protein